MIQWTPARVYTVFEKRKGKVPRTTTPERPVQVATTLTWTPTTRLQLVEQVGVLAMEEAPAVRLMVPHTWYPRRLHKVRGGTGSYNLPLHSLHLSRQLSHPRRSNHIKVPPLFFDLFWLRSQVRSLIPTPFTPSSSRNPWDPTPLQCR